MKAVETNMLNFMLQPRQQFVIPVYQRTYKWTRLNCKQLLDDIINISKLNNKTHFIGSIVYISDEYFQASKIKQLCIIDGQQRITTISLLLLAMCRYLEKNPNKFTTLFEELYNEYLVIDTYRNKTVKLELTKHDKDIYNKLINNIEIKDCSHNIYSNYKYFLETIKNKNIDIDKLYDGISKLMIVDVSLVRKEDDPQLIFESLNSTGVKLTQADLIRNYLLMDLDIDFQNKIYNNFWFEIENKLGNKKEELSEFIRDYLTMKTQRIPKKTDVYAEFKKYFKDKYSHTESNIEDLVRELYDYATIYEKIINKREKDKEVNQFFVDLNELDVKVINPVLLMLYYDNENNVINKTNFIYILQLIESCIVRRIICSVPTNQLSKICLNVIRNVDKNNYVESIEKILMSKEGTQRFPRDNEFKEQFIIKDIYNLSPSIRRFILNKLENFESKEILNIDEFTIEHIMPQSTNLSKKWVDALGDNWQEIHSKYLHTIGNLSLTRYNSEMSNRFFTEKRDIEGGYRDSSCWLNKGLKDLDTWNEKEIIKRAEMLGDKAMKIWCSPKIDDVNKNYNVILDFEEDWTNKKPKYFTFMDEKHEIKDLTNLYIMAIQLMYEFDPELFLEIIKDEEICNRKIFSYNPNDFNASSPQIADSKLYLNTGCNSNTKRRYLLMLIKKVGLSEDEFIIYL